MNSYLSYKYLLFLNGNYDEYVPKDVLRYIIMLNFDLPRITSFTGLNTTIIIKNNTLKVFGNMFNVVSMGAEIFKGIDIHNIKKIEFDILSWSILCYDGKAYMYTKSIPNKLTYIMDNVEDISVGKWYRAYITKNNELYVHGGGIPLGVIDNRQRASISNPIKLSFKQVKSVICESYRILILRTDGTIFDTCDTQYPNVDPFKCLTGSLPHKVAISINNKIYNWDDKFKHNPKLVIINNEVGSIKMIASSIAHFYILNTRGEVYVCGYKECIKYGPNDAEYRKLKKIEIPAADSIHCGTDHVVVVLTNGQIYCWGHNTNYQLGSNCKYYGCPTEWKL